MQKKNTYSIDQRRLESNSSEQKYLYPDLDEEIEFLNGESFDMTIKRSKQTSAKPKVENRI
jgi:hypothetical protein